MAMRKYNQRHNGTINLNESDRHQPQVNWIAQSTGNNLMVDYDCTDVMVSKGLEGKIEWLQELGPIVRQSLDVSNGNLWCCSLTDLEV